ncbi:coiled-coil domain-containing protein 50 isoform X2 [Zootoca vivipara]|uniref:coiled-coil domain-containing protein 50 isoform X2 n=1 Tax=Zootoca vivipara TaxID=8524 RepID=UPI00293BB2E8|nr:coiled-coil domain-containing protein 50 isoform X2 [Zootoca vivipara]
MCRVPPLPPKRDTSCHRRVCMQIQPSRISRLPFSGVHENAAQSLKMTEVQIDTSRLPPVQEVCRDFAVLEDGALAYSLQEQEIEQHYTSNIQKNQLVQKDIRIAKKLQDLEEEARRKHQLSEQQRELEDRDSDIARATPEDIRREAEESCQRKAKDQEIAKQLQDLEEESLQKKQQLWLRSSSPTQRGGGEDDSLGPLNWVTAELELQNQQQVQQDEELARELQAEEVARLKARKNRERHNDYRAAQVAQDEEIARYMQDQELKAQWRSPRRSKAMTGAGASGKGTTMEEAAPSSSPSQEEAQESCGTALPTGLWSSDSSEVPTNGGQPDIRLSLRPQLCRNIAEDLDPTFRAQRAEAPAGMVALCSRAAAAPGGRSVPAGGFFDYPDELGEPAFVSPTKRQPEKVGRQKPRDKKEGCKQQ